MGRRMAELRTFIAFRPPAALARRVAAPLHDWITPDRAGRLAADNPLSLVRISHAHVDLGQGVAPGSAAAGAPEALPVREAHQFGMRAEGR